ncbi:hypothetical protein ACLI07_09940 [Providencia huaxiensis]|uniref:hypothetical protein n=1 Tax=Providencia TaxID=586 RepID=UPI0018C6258C|nr:hypothetical protein [Providencia rettgeri]MBG5923693.1 hypothetical protein [Providencia rettgeri]
MSLKHISEVTKEVLSQKGKVTIKDNYIILKPDDELDFVLDIRISDCDTHEKLLSWIFYLTNKQWATTQLIREFIVIASRESNIKINE